MLMPVSRFLLVIFVAVGLLSSVSLLLLSSYLKDKSVKEMAVAEASRSAELIFQSLYAVMRSGNGRHDLPGIVEDVRGILPDMEIRVVRGAAVIADFGAADGSALQAPDPLLRTAMESGLRQLQEDGGNLRFLYPLIAREECLRCHVGARAGQVNGVVDIQFPVERLRLPLEYTLTSVFGVFAALLLILFLLIYGSVRVALVHPIARLDAHIRRLMGQEDPHQRLPEGRHRLRETASLAQAFNDLLTRLERAYSELLERSERDNLTGLYNRRKLEQLIAEELFRARRYRHRCSLLLIDLDQFKPVNDRHGHAAGDALLLEVAGVLAGTLRQSDAVGRIGGDEFLVLVPETDGPAAEQLAAKLTGLIESIRLRYGVAELRVGASIGWSTFPEDAEDPDELRQIADRRMYRVKGKGAR